LWHGIIRAPGVFVASTKGSSGRRLVVRASSGSGATKVKDSRRYNITLLPGDGIGPEIMRVAVDVLKAVGTLEGKRMKKKISHHVGQFSSVLLLAAFSSPMIM
jgi:hypothetical protein